MTTKKKRLRNRMTHDLAYDLNNWLKDNRKRLETLTIGEITAIANIELAESLAEAKSKSLGVASVSRAARNKRVDLKYKHRGAKERSGQAAKKLIERVEYLEAKVQELETFLIDALDADLPRPGAYRSNGLFEGLRNGEETRAERTSEQKGAKPDDPGAKR